MDNDIVATARTRTARPVTLARLRARRRAILGVLDRHGLSNPRVFGSVAAGSASAQSDVDLAVDWAPGRRPRGFEYYSAVADAQLELSELLGVPVDIVPVEQAKPRLAAAIERDAPPL
jgi:predicted nucleotidyltransferase